MFYASDLISQYYPWYFIAKKWLVQGKLPHWVPDLYGTGYPLLAEGEVGVLSPINYLLLRFLPFAWAVNTLYIVYGLTAIGGMWWWLRQKSLSHISCFLSGIIFCFSGFMISRYFQPAIIFTTSLMPFGFAIIEKAKTHKQALLCLPLIIYLQFTAGHLQMALTSILGYITYAGLISMYHKKDLVFPAQVLWFSMLGISMSAIQLLPSLQLFKHSTRSDWDPMIRFTYSLPPSHFITYLNPEAFGISQPGDNAGFHQIGGSFWEFNLTIWTVPFLLSGIPLFQLVSKKNKPVEMSIFYSMWILFFCLSLGGYFKPYHIVGKIPGFPFRAPVRFLAICTLAAAALSGYGFEMLTRTWRKLPRYIGFVVVSIGMVFQIHHLLRDYIKIVPARKVMNDLNHLNNQALTTPLPLNPNIMSHPAIFTSAFRYGKILSEISLISLITLWWLWTKKPLLKK